MLFRSLTEEVNKVDAYLCACRFFNLLAMRDELELRDLEDSDEGVRHASSRDKSRYLSPGEGVTSSSEDRSPSSESDAKIQNLPPGRLESLAPIKLAGVLTSAVGSPTSSPVASISPI